MSLNRWVFKWRLKVRMFSNSRMSAGREFQVDGAATEKVRRASSVCMRGTTSIGASEERRARDGARVCTSSLKHLDIWVKGHSRSFKLVQFESLGEVSYSCYSNYGSILYHFRDKARYWSKIIGRKPPKPANTQNP